MRNPTNGKVVEPIDDELLVSTRETALEYIADLAKPKGERRYNHIGRLNLTAVTGNRMARVLARLEEAEDELVRLRSLCSGASLALLLGTKSQELVDALDDVASGLTPEEGKALRLEAQGADATGLPAPAGRLLDGARHSGLASGHYLVRDIPGGRLLDGL